MFVSSLIISIYIARVLGPEAKGMYYLLVQMAALAALFGMLGINNAVIYFSGRERMGRSELFTHVLFLTLICGLVLFALVTASRGFLLGSILKGIPAVYVSIMTLVIPLLMLHQMSLSAILGLNKIVLFNLFQIICYILILLNFSVFAVGLKMGILGAYLGILVTYLFLDCAYMALVIKKITPRIRWDKIKDILHYGLRSFLGGHICFICILRLDSFMLNYFNNIGEVGFYSIALGLAELILLIPLVTGTVLFPKLASQEKEALNASAVKVVRVVFSFLILLAVTFLMAGKWIILLIYGQMYNASLAPMLILLPGFIFISLFYLFFSYFGAVGRPEIVTIILVATLIVKFFSSLFAVSRWGMIGAAAASTVSYVLCGFALLTAFYKKSKKSLKDIFVVRRDDIKYVWNVFTRNAKPVDKALSQL